MALSVATGLLGACSPGTGARIIALVGGPCTEGPGTVKTKKELLYVITTNLCFMLSYSVILELIFPGLNVCFLLSYAVKVTLVVDLILCNTRSA